jgi:hypothetical protein
MVCAFLPVLLAHMYLFTSRIAERYLIYILPFFFLVSSAVIEALFWGLVNWLRALRQSERAPTTAAAILCAVPAAWLFLQPWLNMSIENRRYGVGPDWKQIAPELMKACDEGTVITTWAREVLYYGGSFPDYFATQTYEYHGKPDHEVVVGDDRIEVRYLLDAETFGRVLDDDTDVYFVTTDWAFSNDAFMSEAMREVVRSRMEEVASVAAGDDRAVIYRAHAR